MADLLGLTFLFLANLTTPLKDYGTRGQTFSIEEEDLLDFIQKRAQEDLFGEKIREHYSNSFRNPRPVLGLKEAQKRDVHYFDPTITAKADIKDEQGKTIIPKGAAYNPLEQFSLSQDLLFFDGEQKEHLQWARKFGKESKWILVKGKPFELEEKENRPIFFDQSGLLVRKLSIESVPARVTQEGLQLKIESIPVKELLCGS